jgi:hypothetical protein
MCAILGMISAALFPDTLIAYMVRLQSAVVKRAHGCATEVYARKLGKKECADAIAWWEYMTGKGGEGMVVKPAPSSREAPKGLIQSALKVRGREYLRIIYGPEYDARTRFVAGEPLRRLHECVSLCWPWKVSRSTRGCKPIATPSAIAAGGVISPSLSSREPPTGGSARLWGPDGLSPALAAGFPPPPSP